MSSCAVVVAIANGGQRSSARLAVIRSTPVFGEADGDTHPASISGTLCRSTTCDGNDSSVRAAVRVLRTVLRYGLSVFDCVHRRAC